MNGPAMRPILAAALAALAVAAPSAGSAEDAPVRRDAAEVVKEGDVSQWLQHYQRERAEAWAKQQDASRQTPAPEQPTLQQPDRDAPDRDR